jgi:hypothetical protein
MVKRRKRREKATRMAHGQDSVAIHDPGSAGHSNLQRIPTLQEE